MKKIQFCFIFMIFIFVSCKTSPFKVQTVFEDTVDYGENVQTELENYTFKSIIEIYEHFDKRYKYES